MGFKAGLSVRGESRSASLHRVGHVLEYVDDQPALTSLDMFSQGFRRIAILNRHFRLGYDWT